MTYSVNVIGWAKDIPVELSPRDGRITVDFSLSPNRTAMVGHFDLQLKDSSGIVLREDRMPVLVEGKPLRLLPGAHLQMSWHISSK